jgi:UDPglucose 6-dehydrogenase
MENVKRQKGYNITYAHDQYEALQGADCLLICTEWSAFRNPDFERMTSLLNSKTIFDGRNLYDLSKMDELGYHYHSIGRQVIS